MRRVGPNSGKSQLLQVTGFIYFILLFFCLSSLRIVGDHYSKSGAVLCHMEKLFNIVPLHSQMFRSNNWCILSIPVGIRFYPLVLVVISGIFFLAVRAPDKLFFCTSLWSIKIFWYSLVLEHFCYVHTLSMRCEAFFYVTTSWKLQDDSLFLLLISTLRHHIIIIILTTLNILSFVLWVLSKIEDWSQFVDSCTCHFYFTFNPTVRFYILSALHLLVT